MHLPQRRASQVSKNLHELAANCPRLGRLENKNADLTGRTVKRIEKHCTITTRRLMKRITNDIDGYSRHGTRLDPD